MARRIALKILSSSEITTAADPPPGSAAFVPDPDRADGLVASLVPSTITM